jgi:hypothetical protein
LARPHLLAGNLFTVRNGLLSVVVFRVGWHSTRMFSSCGMVIRRKELGDNLGCAGE